MNLAPRTKATYAHEIQQEIGRLSPAARDQIAAACGHVWQDIENSLASTWLDEATFNQLTEAHRSVLGDAETRAFYRRVGRTLAKNPFFKVGLDAVIRLSGMSPHPLVRFATHARALVVRNAGQLTYRRESETCAVLTMVDFPPSTWQSGTTAIMLAGTWEGVVDLAGKEPLVDIEDLDLAGGACRFRVAWS